MASQCRTIAQFIPRMPKKVDELVVYWIIRGSSFLGHPVKNYRSPKFRRNNVPGYSDKSGEADIANFYRSMFN